MLALKAFFRQVKQVPKGFKRVFFEAKHAFQIRDKRFLTRREYEMVRNSSLAVRKVGLFFVLQLPPVIGLLPVCYLYWCVLLCT